MTDTATLSTYEDLPAKTKEAADILAKMVGEVINRDIATAEYAEDFEALGMDSMDVISLMLLIEEEFPEFADNISDDEFVEEMRKIGNINGIAAKMVEVAANA